VALAFLTALPLAGGEPPGPCGEAFVRLGKTYEHVVSIRARFRHVLVAKTLNQTEVEEGTVTLAPGGKMRWEYTQPAGKLAVADGRTSTLYLPEGREVFVQKLSEGPGEPLLFRLLSGRVRLEEEMACDGVTTRGEEAVLTLRLLRSDAEVHEVEVTTAASTGQVLQVRYHDALGNEVSLSLQDIQALSAVPESLFVFKIPEGARVFRGD
jgi:outer membrane lipoprotein carrier protein